MKFQALKNFFPFKKGVLFFGLLLLFTFLTASADTQTGVLDTVMDKYQQAASAWGSIMLDYASYYFWMLALISMVWTYGTMALRKADMQEFFAETIRFFATLGFFWWLLIHGPEIAYAVIKSMWEIGAKAIGQNSALTPSGIVDIGYHIYFQAIEGLSFWSPITGLIGVLLSLLVLIVLTAMAVNVLLLYISGWVLIYGGCVFLGFGGSRWTSDMALNYYKNVLAVGAQLMAMLLIIGIGKTFLDGYYKGMAAGMSFKEMGVMVVVVLTLYMLSEKIPPMIAGIVGVGGSFGGGGIGSFGAGAVTGAAGMAAAAAATGGAAALAGATQIGGGMSALKAAFDSAQQHMSEGTGKFAGGSGGEGGSGMISTAGKFASQMGSSLAQGVGQVAKEKLGSMKEAAKDALGDTMGGRVAAVLRGQFEAAEANKAAWAEQEAQNNAAESPASEGGSLGAGAQTPTPDGGDDQPSPITDDEISDFVNKKSIGSGEL